jgi:hypothetical protein
MQAALALTMGAGVVCLVLLFRRKLTTARKRIIAGVALAVFLFVPSFKILASLPYFKEIRAPFVFYDVPATFFVAILAGFFVSDFVEASKWRAHAPKIVGVLAILLFIDYWPYEKPMKQNDVPARTLQNLQASYGALRADADWVKTYSFSGRYFHLLGPMYGGKPQVYEAFYNWMSPLGIGLLNQNAWGSLDNHRAFLNLLGARYVVFDKTDPSNTQGQPLQILAAYRQLFTLASENEDFAVFRNDNAHPYVTAYARACLFDGDVHNSPQIAIALAARNWPLVHGQPDTATTYERVYRDGDAPLPPRHDGETVSLTNVALQRADAQTVHIKLSAPSSCLAVIAESYYPFWTATIDGEPTEVLRVSCGLMGVRLPAGAHEIVLHYAAPRAYAVAAVVSVIGLIACFVVALKARS